MKIAHISDLHLRHHLPGTADIPERRSRLMADYLQRAVQHLHAHNPDLLVLSGDLVDYPTDRLDDPATRAQGEADLRLIADILAPLPCPLVVVDGNHDHPELTRKVFGHLPLDQICRGYRVLAFWDAEGEGHVPHRTGAEWQRFQDALEDPDSPPQIHVQHYVIWPHLNGEYPYTYGEGDAMQAAIVASGRVRLVLSGHYHRGARPQMVDNTLFATVPAFSEFPHPFWIYELDGERFQHQTVQLGTR
ncbi:metallophosphoesterase [Litorilinea aerophila]|uniref:Calcineurin-like phosphoesterase domain-containing protein n=1 Tax=Litorilinea aerophila TaxID=1204385 RepID=A0A540V8L6_9CHLR|nr:metallophosphoesterase [Litorilinea aerophila]MCC9078950.1 metallophosphoesterase [Litorilinea aerophila]